MKLRMLGLLLVIALQFAAPARIIFSSQRVLSEGTQLKVKTAPVDPYDLFRGRYVALSTDLGRIELPLDHPSQFYPKQKVYVLLEENTEGFVRLKTLLTRPPKTASYITARVTYVQKTKSVQVAEKNWKSEPANIVHVHLPFNRYYMNEKLAPAAEKLVRDRSRREKQDAYLIIRVLGGKALIESLNVGGVPIEEALNLSAL